jgi:hypothetical protein
MTMVSVALVEDVILKTYDESNGSFCPTDSAGSEVQHSIKKKSAQINYMYFSIYAVVLLSSAIMFPIFGDHREWSVCEVAFDHYLGVWSKIYNQLFFCSAPVWFYVSLQLAGAMLYAIEELSLQIFLLNQRILQISDDHPDYDKLKVGEKILWQNKIFYTLISCIKHHVIILTCGDNKHS